MLDKVNTTESLVSGLESSRIQEVASYSKDLLLHKLNSSERHVLSDRNDKQVIKLTDENGKSVVVRTYPIGWLPESSIISRNRIPTISGIEIISDRLFDCGLLPEKPYIKNTNELDTLCVLPYIEPLGKLRDANPEVKFDFVSSFSQFIEFPISPKQFRAHDLLLTSSNFVYGRYRENVGIYLIDIDPEFSDQFPTIHTYARVLAILLDVAEGLSDEDKFRFGHEYLKNLNPDEDISNEKLDFLMSLDLLRNGLNPFETNVGKLANTYQFINR